VHFRQSSWQQWIGKIFTNKGRGRRNKVFYIKCFLLVVIIVTIVIFAVGIYRLPSNKRVQLSGKKNEISHANPSNDEPKKDDPLTETKNILSAEGAKVNAAMVNPVFHGVDRHNRPYRFVANRAYQEQKDRVQMEGMIGQIKFLDGQTMVIMADRSLLEVKTKKAFLKENVSVFGYDEEAFYTESLAIDLALSQLETDQPIYIHTREMELWGQGAVMQEGGQKIIVKGRVRCIIHSF
jgi:hypothetical protein